MGDFNIDPRYAQLLKFNKNSWQAVKISTEEALAKEIIYRKQAISEVMRKFRRHAKAIT